MKQVNQLHETTATKATEPGKTNACPNPSSAAHPQCTGTTNNRQRAAARKGAAQSRCRKRHRQTKHNLHRQPNA
jgi:hypothetical protein